MAGIFFEPNSGRIVFQEKRTTKDGTGRTVAGSHFGDTMNELDSKSYLNSLEFVHKLNTILRELFEQYVGKNRNRQKERKKGRKLLDAVDYVNSHGGGENF